MIVSRNLARGLPKPTTSARRAWASSVSSMALAAGFSTGAQAADKPAEEKGASEEAYAHDPWNGFYVGGRLGQAGGRSNWSGPDIWGTSGLAKAIDTFTETGSFLGGFQGGYNLLLPHNVLVGVETDFTFPAYPDLTGLDGRNGQFQLADARARELYGGVAGRRERAGPRGLCVQRLAAYATGGFAWARTQQTLTKPRAERSILPSCGGQAGSSAEASRFR